MEKSDRDLRIKTSRYFNERNSSTEILSLFVETADVEEGKKVL